jgi:hypothetical protein
MSCDGHPTNRGTRNLIQERRGRRKNNIRGVCDDIGCTLLQHDEAGAPAGNMVKVEAKSKIVS